MNINPKFLIAILILVVALGGLFLFGRRSTGPVEQQFQGELEVWGVFDDSGVFDDIAQAYRTERGADIVYRKVSFESYEEDLVTALAAGRGPDLFMVHNTWLPKHADKMTPAPEGWVTPSQMQNTFVDTVAEDMVDDAGQVYGVPLYVDSLALYYNRDFLNTAGIAEPPETWAEVFDAVEKLVQRDAQGRITRAGIAIGTAENVNRSTDILALLMMQSGSDIISRERKRVTFDDTLRPQGGQSFVPGEDALRFYTDFANPSKRVYTWNPNLDFSIDMFSTQRAAMMVNYQHHIPTLRAQTPFLNFGVAPMPQIGTSGVDVNYASYWSLGVARSAAFPQEAWRFLLWMAQRNPQTMYQEATGRPPARRDLVTALEDDPDVGVFARQALTARSWWQPDNTAVEEIFADMIQTVVLGEGSARDAVRTGAERIEALIRSVTGNQ